MDAVSFIFKENLPCGSSGGLVRVSPNETGPPLLQCIPSRQCSHGDGCSTPELGFPGNTYICFPTTNVDTVGGGEDSSVQGNDDISDTLMAPGPMAYRLPDHPSTVQDVTYQTTLSLKMHVWTISTNPPKRGDLQLNWPHFYNVPGSQLPEGSTFQCGNNESRGVADRACALLPLLP